MVNPISLTTKIFTELNKTTSSLLPVAIKDSADIVGRTTMAKQEGGKHEARERFIEETSTSLVWLGGIPLSRWLFDKAIINPLGFDSKTNLELFDKKKNKFQNLQDNFEKIKDVKLKDQNLADLSKNLGNSINKEISILGKSINKYKALQVVKAVITTLVPMVLLSHTLVKMNFDLTDKIKKKELEEKYNKPEISQQAQNIQQPQNKKDLSFSSLKNFMVDAFSPVALATSATNNPLANMGALDLAISGGRIANARNTNEKIEYGIKEGGIIFFIYMGGKLIQDSLEWVIKQTKGLNVNLSPVLLDDKKEGGFLKKVEEMVKDPSKKAEWMNFDKKKEKEILDTISTHLKGDKKEFANGEFVNPVLKAAQKTGLIKLLETADGKFVLDPRKYIDTDKIAGLNKDIVAFTENASKNKASSLTDFFAQAKKIKRISLIANLMICNLAVGYAVPKLQYMVREKRTGTKMAPGHEKYAKMEKELQTISSYKTA
ncbi:MAG: hypothetical protein WCF95_00345 [bacterium]